MIRALLCRLGFCAPRSESDDLPSKSDREWAKLHSYICEANLCPEGFRIGETTADVAIRLLKKHVPASSPSHIQRRNG